MNDANGKTNEYFSNLAKEKISMLVDHDLLTEEEGRKISFGYFPRTDDAYVIEVFLSTGEVKIRNGIPLDNHQDTIRLCRVEIDKNTEKAQVTIFHETAWLKRDKLHPVERQ